MVILFFFLLLISIAAGFVADLDSVDRLFEGSVPSRRTFAVAACSLVGLCVFVLVPWIMFGRSFRKHFIGQKKSKFDEWWHSGKCERSVLTSLVDLRGF